MFQIDGRRNSLTRRPLFEYKAYSTDGKRACPEWACSFRPIEQKLKACKRGRRDELNTLVCLELLASAPATIEALRRTGAQIEYNETPE